MKLIGVDYGRRRIGVAVTDETGEYIRSLPTIDRRQSGDWFNALCAVVAAETPSQIVVGLPLGTNDEETSMSREVRVFAKRLGTTTRVPVHYVDESLTSVRASVLVRNRKKKERRNKGNVDKIAACLILEAFQKEKH
jgi:putative holliday junction resolvase